MPGLSKTLYCPQIAPKPRHDQMGAVRLFGYFGRSMPPRTMHVNHRHSFVNRSRAALVVFSGGQGLHRLPGLGPGNVCPSKPSALDYGQRHRVESDCREPVAANPGATVPDWGINWPRPPAGSGPARPRYRHSADRVPRHRDAGQWACPTPSCRAQPAVLTFAAAWPTAAA